MKEARKEGFKMTKHQSVHPWAFSSNVTILIAFILFAFTIRAESGKVWYRMPGNSVAIGISAVRILGPNFSSRCALESTRSSNSYKSFCYRVSTSECFVNIMTSLTAPVTPNSDLECFGQCPSELGYTMYYGRCIKLYRQGLNQTGASDLCTGDGAHLYYLKSTQLDVQAINDIINIAGGDAIVWLGANDAVTEGSFQWLDGTPVSTTAPWMTGEPNNAPGVVDYVIFRWATQRLYDLAPFSNSAFSVPAWPLCQIDL